MAKMMANILGKMFLTVLKLSSTPSKKASYAFTFLKIANKIINKI
jgi:hypothetical protein